MKLLIVDDEKLTREGILKSLPLEKLGIHQTFLADDGIHGLKIALKEKPDLILTDVRMPRMSGVEMAEEILKVLPNAIILFMSAYSDKEYLKAAIKLKAVSYVDKPLDMNELTEALSEGIRQYRSIYASLNAKWMHEYNLRSQLAQLLTEADPDEQAPVIGAQLKPSVGENSYFTALILDCLTPVSELPSEHINEIQHSFQEYLAQKGFQALDFVKTDRFIIYFICSNEKPEKTILINCATDLKDRFKGLTSFFLSMGPVVLRFKRASFSFEAARELLKRSFFHDPDTLLIEAENEVANQPLTDITMDLTVALTNKNEEAALAAADHFYQSVHNSPAISSSQVRDLYFKYLVKLDEISMSNHISLWQREGLESESIWEGIMACAALKTLHQFFCKKIKLYFERLLSNKDENPVVFQIKEYLHHNYAVPSLSVPDISEHVHLSPAYVCTLFKSETGQTLNQYLTDYRIKMSKQFLSDPLYKITDISAKVGYSDGNYYSKAFRKIVGLSPSEYREKML